MGNGGSHNADPEYGCLIQKEPLLLTPKGLNSTGVFHKSSSSSKAQTLPPAMPLPRPPLSMSLLMAETAPSAATTTTSFTSSSTPTENYYATADIIHVSPFFRPESAGISIPHFHFFYRKGKDR